MIRIQCLQFVKIIKNHKMGDHQNWQSYESLELATFKSEANLHTDLSRQLDLQYLSLRQKIMHSKHYARSSKHLRIRLNVWLQKLDQIITNPIWKRNRNSYAKLINLMCECEVVVEPFLSLPPQSDVPKLSKHEINQIIDEVEREVKLVDRCDHKGFAKDKNDRLSKLKPEEYWSRIKRVNYNGRQNNTEQESLYIGKFTSIQEKYKEALSLSNINGDFRTMTEGNKSLKASQKKNVYFSDIQDCDRTVECFKGKQNTSLTKASLKPGKHILVALKPKLQTLSNKAESKQEWCSSQSKQNMPEDDSKQSRLQAFRDGHVSIQLENQTLKTEMFDQDLSIHPQIMQDFSQISLEECDYTDQLSQRFRIKPEVISHSYFTQKYKKKQLA